MEHYASDSTFPGLVGRYIYFVNNGLVTAVPCRAVQSPVKRWSIFKTQDPVIPCQAVEILIKLKIWTAKARVASSNFVMVSPEVPRAMHWTINQVVWRTTKPFEKTSPLLLSWISFSEIRGQEIFPSSWGSSSLDIDKVKVGRNVVFVAKHESPSPPLRRNKTVFCPIFICQIISI